MPGNTPTGLRGPVPSGTRGAAPGARGKPAARDDVRTPVQITPAVVSAEQSVSDAFTTAGLIPGHVDFRNFSYSGFSDIVRGA